MAWFQTSGLWRRGTAALYVMKCVFSLLVCAKLWINICFWVIVVRAVTTMTERNNLETICECLYRVLSSISDGVFVTGTLPSYTVEYITKINTKYKRNYNLTPTVFSSFHWVWYENMVAPHVVFFPAANLIFLSMTDFVLNILQPSGGTSKSNSVATYWLIDEHLTFVLQVNNLCWLATHEMWRTKGKSSVATFLFSLRFPFWHKIAEGRNLTSDVCVGG